MTICDELRQNVCNFADQQMRTVNDRFGGRFESKGMACMAMLKFDKVGEPQRLRAGSGRFSLE